MANEIESSPPPGWDEWSYEQRRIWRLEQQLLRWEAIGLAARDYAHGVAAQLAEARREEAPTTTDVTEAILRLARTRGLPGPGGWPSTTDGDDG